MQATLEEMAFFFDVSTDTIERAVKREQDLTFAEYFKWKSAKGKISLRRMQYNMALAGDSRMLQWLGRCMLGQNPSAKLEIEVPPNGSGQAGKPPVGINELRSAIAKWGYIELPPAPSTVAREVVPTGSIIEGDFEPTVRDGAREGLGAHREPDGDGRERSPELGTEDQCGSGNHGPAVDGQGPQT